MNTAQDYAIQIQDLTAEALASISSKEQYSESEYRAMIGRLLEAREATTKAINALIARTKFDDEA